jgi:Sensors of blue-light using FAD
MLVRCLYASRMQKALTTTAQNAILDESRKNNTKAGITGILLSSGTIFVQLLEGGREEVSKIYNRIVVDPRHKDVVLLVYEEITERRFEGWSMGQVNLDGINPAMMLKYSETATLNPYASSGQATMALLNELVATGSIICGNATSKGRRS